MRSRRTEFWLGLWTLSFIGATAAVAYLSPSPKQRDNPAGGLTLRVNDQRDRIRVDWDTGNELVRNAQSGTVEVNDGGALDRFPMDSNTLRVGGFDYIRKTPEVLLTLTLVHNGKPAALATVRSVGPVQAQAAPPIVVERPVRRQTRQSRNRRR